MARSDSSRCDAEQTPADPYDEDNAVHVDKVTPFNGDRKASFAYNDAGDRFKVASGDRYPKTRLIPEDEWRETWMPEREGVGEGCVGCGDVIEWDAIIVHEEYHLRCYLDTDTDQTDQ